MTIAKGALFIKTDAFFASLLRKSGISPFVVDFMLNSLFLIELLICVTLERTVNSFSLMGWSGQKEAKLLDLYHVWEFLEVRNKYFHSRDNPLVTLPEFKQALGRPGAF